MSHQEGDSIERPLEGRIIQYCVSWRERLPFRFCLKGRPHFVIFESSEMDIAVNIMMVFMFDEVFIAMRLS